MRLTRNNYNAGPEKDRDAGREGEVWKFGASLDKAEHYIKLKIETREGKTLLKVLSFHPADWPLTYPHRRQQQATRPKIR